MATIATVSGVTPSATFSVSAGRTFVVEVSKGSVFLQQRLSGTTPWFYVMNGDVTERISSESAKYFYVPLTTEYRLVPSEGFAATAIARDET